MESVWLLQETVTLDEETHVHNISIHKTARGANRAFLAYLDAEYEGDVDDVDIVDDGMRIVLPIELAFGDELGELDEYELENVEFAIEVVEQEVLD